MKNYYKSFNLPFAATMIVVPGTGLVVVRKRKVFLKITFRKFTLENLFGWVFKEKINSVICWVMLGLALMFIAFQAFRGITNHLLIASL